jgi:hypothetical protein
LIFWHALVIVVSDQLLIRKTDFKKKKNTIMKKSILSLVILLTVAVSSVLADDGKDAVSQKVLTSFKEKFSGASIISWNKESDFQKATFSFNNQVLFAYFDVEGNLVATVRNILSDKLPINLLVSLKREYSNFWISELLEVDSDWAICYYITLENENKVIKMRADSGMSWEVSRKIKKEDAQ